MAHTQDAPLKLLREWAPLTDLFNKLPTKVQTGIFSQEIKLTCLDVLPEFLALGTNVGIVYWFDRKKKDLQRLRCENSNIPITCVKVLSTVDYMVACGNNLGNISIFQIPKSHPDNIPENLLPKQKQVERYTVTELHKAPISAIEWAKNGMKLFSGDQNGCVILTEIDFYMHICKSLEILNESYEVVQLSYNQQFLLVSTTYRSIICQQVDKWKVCQVGKKDRKVLGKFGGIIYQNGYKATDSCLYCTRPGLRIWISDIEGNVQKTLLFKDLLCKECPEIPLINPISRNLRHLKPQKEPAFGILLSFNQTLLVTYSNGILYILDPQQMSILSTISHLRSILCVATHKDEIFILEEERSLIRISYKPESFNVPSNISSSGNTFLPITSIKDITSKLQSNSIISAIPPEHNHTPFTNHVNVHTDETLVMNAEEAKESPIKIRNNVDLETQKKFDSIGKQEFEDKILFKKSHRTHKKRLRNGLGNGLMSSSINSLSSNSSEEKDLSYTRPTIMNLSAVGVLPDLRSPESIKNDIEYKEKILADVLSLDKVKISKGPTGNVENQSSSTSIDGATEPKDEIVEVKHMKKKHEGNATKKEVNGKSYTLDKDKKRIVPDFDHLKSKPKQHTAANRQNSSPVVLIPNDWKLSSIRLDGSDKTTTTVGSSDTSLSDWEII